MFNTDDTFSDDTHEAEETPMTRVKDLITELMNIYMLIQDGDLEEAYDELECQSGTIESIMRDIYND